MLKQIGEPSDTKIGVMNGKLYSFMNPLFDTVIVGGDYPAKKRHMVTYHH